MMNLFKKTILLSLCIATAQGYSQVKINQNITNENGKLKIHVEKEENGKKKIFDQTFNIEGLSNDEQQALIERVTDSLTAGSDKNMQMRVKVDRKMDNDEIIIENDPEPRNKMNQNQKKKIIIKKDSKNNRENNEEIDINLDDLPMDFNFNGQDFDLGDLQNKMGDLGKTLQYKFEEFGPMMQKFGKNMEPQIRKFGDKFDFDMNNNSSKTIEGLSAYPNKPNNNKLNVKFTALEKGQVNITVADINGKVIGTEKLLDFTGDYFGQVDLKGNAKGTVFLTVVQGEDGSIKRIVLN